MFQQRPLRLAFLYSPHHHWRRRHSSILIGHLGLQRRPHLDPLRGYRKE